MLAPTAGENDGSSSRIVIRDNSADRRLDPPDPSTSTPGRKDGVTRRRIILRPISPMLMILTAIHKRNTSSNVPDEGPSHVAHDPRPADPLPEALAQEVVDDKGAVTGGSPDASLGHVSGGKDADDAVQPARPGGKCDRRDNLPRSLTTSTCRKRLESQGDWGSCNRIRCRQGGRRGVWSSQGCP